MIVPRARRAAEFEALVEGTSRAPGDGTSAELLELVGALRELGEPGRRPEPRPAFVTDLRERLLVAAREELVVEDPVVQQLTVRPGRTSRDRRLSAALAGFALVGATASVGVAAQGALPGEALYPVKRAIENAETGIATSDASRGAELLENARTRLGEVDALAATGDPEVAAVEETLDDFAAQATEASDLLLADYEATGDTEEAQELRDFAAEGIEKLGELDGRLPEESHGAVLEAAQVLFTIDAAVGRLCPTCVGGVTEIPTQLLAGTGPAKGAASAGRTTAADRSGKGKGGDASLPAAPEAPASVTEVLPGSPEAPADADSGLTDDAADAPTSVPAEVGKVGEKVTKPVTKAVEDTVEGVEGTVEGTTQGLEETATDVTGSVDDVLGGLTGTAGQ